MKPEPRTYATYPLERARGRLNFKALVSLLESTHAALQHRVAAAANQALVARNWLMGRHIIEFEQRGIDRARYGEELLPRLSESLAARSLKGFSVTNLKLFRQFYLAYPGIGQTSSRNATSRRTS